MKQKPKPQNRDVQYKRPASLRRTGLPTTDHRAAGRLSITETWMNAPKAVPLSMKHKSVCTATREATVEFTYRYTHYFTTDS